MALAAILLGLSFCLASCSAWSEIDRNNANIAKLRVGMSKDEVKSIMGEPLTKEIYNTPSIWFYYTRTRWSDGAATHDECTPLLFDEDGKLAGWGQEYYRRNYEFYRWGQQEESASSK